MLNVTHVCWTFMHNFLDKIAQMFLFCRQVSDVHWKESKASRGQSKVVNKIKILSFFKSNSNISHFDYKIIIVDVIHQIYIKSYSKYHKLYITYFHQMIKWKLHSQIFFMVGVWLSGVFIFAGDNNDNKYEAIKSNINSRNCFII